MDIAFLKLCKEIKYTPKKVWSRTFLTKVKLVDKVFSLYFQIDDLIPVNEMKEFLSKLNKNFKYKSKPLFKISKKSFDKTKIVNYLKWIISDILEKKSLSKELEINNCELDNTGNLTFHSISLKNYETFKKIEEKTLRIMSIFGIKNIKIKINPINNITQKKYETQEIDLAKLLSKKTSNKFDSKNDWGWKKIDIDKNTLYLKIEDVAHEENLGVNIETEGEIFDIKHFRTKNNKLFLIIQITNLKEAIIVKKMVFNNNEEKSFLSFKNGDLIKVYGELKKENNKSASFYIEARQIAVIQKTTKNKTKDQRIELSARTKMSSMDGLCSPKEYYDEAKKRGIKAIGITDLDSVQSFPDFYNIVKKDPNFKGIFGFVTKLLKKENKQKTSKPKFLKNQEYVVFDLETTGFHAKYNGIIEFGACRIINNKIVDTKQFFINPQQKISKKITELTGISNSDVKNAIKERDAIKEITEYFKDAILVAHNAKFDMSFIHAKTSQYKLPKVENVVVDTLFISRWLTPKIKKHTLGLVAKRFFVEYDAFDAHRADYDAKILGNIWIKMIHQLREKNILTTTDLLNIKQRTSNFKQNNSGAITLIAKNNAGLKNLFKLLSISNTTNYQDTPTLYKDDINKYKEGILIGTSGLEGVVWGIEVDGTQEELEEEMMFYDYVEINPISNYSHLIKRDDIKIENVKQGISNIILTAKKLNKIIVVTTEPRYINKNDKQIHKIYIESKGLGGKSHNLFKYKEENPDYPSLHFKTGKELEKEFSFLNNNETIKEIIYSNPQKIADQIEKIVVLKSDLYTPTIEGSTEALKTLVFNRAKKLYGDPIPTIVQERINKEMGVIIRNKYDVIYWISHLLVKKSLELGSLVGSRGSVGSSLVATLANITEVNPLQPHYLCTKCKYTEFPKTIESKSGYDLEDKNCPKCNSQLQKDGHTIPFETFLGFDGEKIPDIDLNFSGEYQHIIHSEVRKIFGEDHCFRAGTISTVAERTAFGYVKAWAEDHGIEYSTPFINYLTKKLSGTKRTTGQHPGGIVVVPQNLDIEDFTPINYPANDTNSQWKTTHFDFNAIHNNLLKLDLLGHDDPTAIRMLQKLTGVSPNHIPNFDKATLSLFSSTKALKIKPDDISGETTGAMGIPEFGTNFVRGILKTVKVKSFSDLISISGLSHGTDVWINNAKEYVEKNNKNKITLTIEEIISCRDDILNDLTEHKMNPKDAFIIMEQVRKGKSITKEQEQNMIDHNVPRWYIDSCKKIKYMFPKAHATAYVKMAWRVAWFKINYPLAYYATYLSVRANSFDIKIMSSTKSKITSKLASLKKRYKSKNSIDKLTTKEEELIPTLEICEEMYARGFKIEVVNIEKSRAKQWVINEKEKSLIPPFGVVDGLGEVVAKVIEDERNKRPYISIQDFKTRTKINKTSLKHLLDLGTFRGVQKENQLSLF